MTEYLKLLEAVEQYYGAGSDQWVTIATSSNISSGEWAQILQQTPNVQVIKNNAGEIVSYTVNQPWGTAGDTVASAINSNAQAAELTQAAKLNIPANTTVSQTTGKVVAESGMKTVSSGATVSTVFKNVAVGVGAVASGITLGTSIDSRLYNANPDFWDEHNMSLLNPQTWDTLCSTELGKTVFNFVFGINKNTGKTQAYMDENALAYIAAYMAAQGAFGYYDESADIEDPTGLNLNNTTLPYILTNSFGVVNSDLKFWYDNNISPVRFGVFKNGGIYHIIMASENPFNGCMDGHYSWTDIVPAHTVTVKNKTFYVYNSNYSIGSAPVYGNVNTATGGVDINSIAYVLLYGDITQSGGVEGITEQEDATQPTGIDPAWTIAAVLAYLQTLYPDLFNDAIYNDVIQDDGTIKRYRYVPVGLPDNITINETTGAVEPTGGTDMQQDNTTIDDVSPDNLIKTLIEILSATNPSNPTTPTDDVQTDFPDTGTGNTPPFVIPTGSASALYSVYNPTQAQLNSLGAWLWSSNFVDQLLKLFNDPMQAIIGLHKVFASPSISGSGTIKVGYLDSGVGSNLVGSQYSEIDCGNVNLREYFGNVLDYTNTDIYLYLPFIGIVTLNTVDVMRARINVKYKVDVLTGACLASVNVNRDNNAGGQLYVYAGNCAVQYPLSSGSYMGIVAGILGVAGSVAGTILSGGALLPMALGAGASAMGSMKTKVEHSGSLSGNSGAMGIKKPYLIIRRPQTKIAHNFEFMAGASNNEYGILGTYTGYTRVKYVHLENIPATREELTEIESYLKSGVLI